MPLRILIALSQDFVGISRLPRLFSNAGIEVSAIAPANFFLQRSRFVNAHHPCDPAPESVVNALREHLSNVSEPYAMVILGDDPLQQCMVRHASEPWVRAILPIDLNRVPPAFLCSKAEFATLCRRAGLPIPKTFSGTTLQEAQQAAAQLSFPAILKDDFGFSGVSVRRIASIGELEKHFATSSTAEKWLLQEEIRGPIATVDVLYEHGRPRAWIASHAVVTRFGPFGPSTRRRFVNLPGIKPILERLGAETGAHGFMGLDLIHEQPSGRLVLLELNCRPTAGHALAEYAGLNFAAELRALLAGEPSKEPQLDLPSRVIPMFPEDFDRAITDKDFCALFRWTCDPTFLRHMPWSDRPLMLRNADDTFKRFMAWCGWKPGPSK